MKVILLQDVAKVGRRYEVAEVPNGYALNRLIPTGMAKPATPENRKQLSNQMQQVAESTAAGTTAFDELISKLEDRVVTVAVELNEQGHMFESLKPESISQALEELGLAFAASNISIPEPIKESGKHTVELAGPERSVKITIKVEGKA